MNIHKPWPRLAFYRDYPLTSSALVAIFREGGWSLRWTGLILGPFGFGVIWRAKLPREGVR